METFLQPLLAIAIGLAGLVWGADRFVVGSAGTARNLGISPLVIGLTIVSIGTSAPEIIVSINAALKGSGELAVGNAIGSNLANIGLVLGITTLVAPVPAQRHLLFEEGPVVLVVTAIIGLILFDGYLGRWESLPLLLAIAPLLWLTVRYKSRHPSPEQIEGGKDIPALSMATALSWFVVGLAALLASSEALVWGATTSARLLGVSELVIGLSIVAIGTSLPELAASVASALRGHSDIAVGNVFGSNLFNLMAVLPIAGVIQPLALGTAVFYRDYLVLALLTIALYLGVAVARRQPRGVVPRKAGLALLAAYGGYCVFLLPGSG